MTNPGLRAGRQCAKAVHLLCTQTFTWQCSDRKMLKMLPRWEHILLHLRGARTDKEVQFACDALQDVCLCRTVMNE